MFLLRKLGVFLALKLGGSLFRKALGTKLGGIFNTTVQKWFAVVVAVVGAIIFSFLMGGQGHRRRNRVKVLEAVASTQKAINNVKINTDRNDAIERMRLNSWTR